MMLSGRVLQIPDYECIVPKKNAKSSAWIYFGFPADSNEKILTENVAICKQCKQPVSNKGGNTTNLVTHLKTRHPLQYIDLMKTRQKTSVSLTISVPTNVEVDKETSASTSKFKQQTLEKYQPLNTESSQKITDSVTKFIATSLQPYYVVENQSFIDMLKSLNPRYALPGRKYFSQTAVPKLYNNVKDRIKSQLSVEVGNISLTCDCWTSVAGNPYICITCHLINEQWKLITACLGCILFDDNHTAENTAEVVKNSLLDWEIDVNQVVACTTDNGTNIINAVRLLKIDHVSCFGHNINIGVNRSLEIPQLKRAVARLKRLQNSVSHSWILKRDLYRAQELLQKKKESLPSACTTRWWSVIKLCKRFLNNQLAIRKMLENHPSKKDLMLEDSDILIIEDFVNVTSNLQEITEGISGEEYCSISCVKPLYNCIKKQLEVQSKDRQLVQNIKNKILNPLLERYEAEPLRSIILSSTFLDPRFKQKFFNDSEKEHAKKTILEQAIEHMRVSGGDTSEEIPNPPAKKRKGLAKILESIVENSSNENLTLEEKCEKELEKYLSFPDVDTEDDPLMWWNTHLKTFPSLEILAKKYLAIQGTSVPSERVFSTGGNVITRQRASLLPKNAAMLIFLFQNRKFISSFGT